MAKGDLKNKDADAADEKKDAEELDSLWGRDPVHCLCDVSHDYHAQNQSNYYWINTIISRCYT
ncbi:hypothetical protein M7I_2284 [Glarea lozoyensis 74030]|uniref:Uncharacterized protein n=1 Tax=Glarea lozoyensis (strain ATCC 74030 / MF5533) TaxID=1104152 RepID=H0EIC9_GLAL7|nr:hypothetical protein M7I_2284 [Glarea lozoyensis 74030]